MVINTQDTNYSTEGMLITTQDTNYSAGGILIFHLEQWELHQMAINTQDQLLHWRDANDQLGH